MIITSVQNQYIRQLTRLKQKKYRDQDQRFIISGWHLLAEALAAELVETILLRDDCNKPVNFANIITVSDNVMKKLTQTVSVPEVAAVCRYKPRSSRLGEHVVLLDRIQDPGNIGTIIRTALAFGYADIVLSADSVDIYNDKLIRSSQGALFTANVFTEQLPLLIEQLKAEAYQILGTSLHNGTALSQIRAAGKVALIFGNEGQGISAEVLKLTDQNIFIEINGFESLNVAVAAGICLYHYRVKK